MLVLFGDSFTSEPDLSEHPSTHATWFKMLADDLGIEYKTYGESGSSFEHSTLKFFEYLTSDNYDPNDQIVFVLTDGNRSPIIAKDFAPKWAALTQPKVFSPYLDAKSRQQISKLTDSDEHYTRFKNFYKDWFLLKNEDLILAQRYMLLQTLHSLPNKTVSISLGESEATIAKHFTKHAKFSLWQISTDEISDGGMWDYVKKHGPHDLRLNHLHEKNHYVLKDAVYSYLNDENFSDFNAESFHKNLFSVK
jgi:hypothetical protein